jgi:drug/metabolite transporter (DMT)-like permease
VRVRAWGTTLVRVHRVPADALLLGTVVLWSFNFTAVAYGVSHGFEPLSYASLRWALAGLALLALAVWRRHHVLVGWRDAGILAAAAVVGVVINQISFVYAFRLASASTVALVFGTLPIFVALFAQLAGMERLHARQWLAAAISFGGVGLVALGAESRLSASLGGIGLALVTALTFAVYSVSVVPVMRRRSPLVVNALTALAGGAMLVVVSSVVLASQDWAAIDGFAWGALLYSALASIALGNLFWFAGIDRVGPGRASLFANLQPFLGAVFAVIVLSESLSVLQAIGGCVIAAGIVLGRRSRFPAPPSE